MARHDLAAVEAARLKAARGGGYICMSSNSIHSGVKPECYLEMVKAFHGHVAPGMIFAGLMVDLAYRNLPPGEFFDAVCETRACLPDAIQILTPCTVGNGWLRIVDIGRFALSFYEKYTGDGVRVLSQ